MCQEFATSAAKKLKQLTAPGPDGISENNHNVSYIDHLFMKMPNDLHIDIIKESVSETVLSKVGSTINNSTEVCKKLSQNPVHQKNNCISIWEKSESETKHVPKIIETFCNCQ